MAQRESPYDSTYVFSAEQQEEVKRLYHKYLPPEESKKGRSEEEEKMERLRRLDKSVTRAGTAAGLVTGLCGAAVHAVGIALIQGDTMFALGTVLAIAGLGLFLAAYPVYYFVVKKRRRKAEAEILRLCRELMK